MSTRVLRPIASMLRGSTDSRAREWRPPPPRTKKPRPGARERGMALILALITITILGVVIVDMQENTAASYALATTQRDRLQAEYLARGSINLTRLLIAAEPQIRQGVAAQYTAMLGRPPPQLPVWSYANEILQPFCNYEGSQGLADDTGIDFTAAEGLGSMGGTCQLVSFAENSKLNLNEPLHLEGSASALNVAMQVYAMVGGYQSPSPYDPLFEHRDADNQITSRLDIVSALVDWWDPDTQRMAFDPGAASVDLNAGSEDDIYQSFADPYRVRNAPFDSLEELRLIRGVGDDFWSTFVEPDPEDFTQRFVTVYGSGKVNPNEAPPIVLLMRTCSILTDQPLCRDAAEAQKFIMLLTMVRQMAPIPWFPNANTYMDFLRGQGTGTGALYPLLQSLGEATQGLLFTPVTISGPQADQLRRALVFGAAIITVQSTAWAGNCEGRTDEGEDQCGDDIDNDGDGESDCDDGGCAGLAGCEAEDSADIRLARCTRVRVRTVINFDSRWTPPPPNAGTMPRMGVVHHWRVD
jgi:general secretion pathway protein K